MAQLPDGPPRRASGQQRPRGRNPRVLFGERPDRAPGVRAGPGPLAPPQHHRPAEAGRVDELDRSPAVAAGHDTAAGAPCTPGGDSTVTTSPSPPPRREWTRATATTCR